MKLLKLAATAATGLLFVLAVLLSVMLKLLTTTAKIIVGMAHKIR